MCVCVCVFVCVCHTTALSGVTKGHCFVLLARCGATHLSNTRIHNLNGRRLSVTNLGGELSGGPVVCVVCVLCV